MTPSDNILLGGSLRYPRAILVITFASLIPILGWPEGFTPHSSRYAPSNRRKPRLILLILTIGDTVESF